MKGLRTRIAAAMLVAAILSAGTEVDLFGAGRHQTCVTQQHHCEKAAQIASCDCCRHDPSGSQSGTPAEARVELLRVNAVGAALPALISPIAATFTVSSYATRPAAFFPLDRPIVFSKLLI